LDAAIINRGLKMKKNFLGFALWFVFMIFLSTGAAEGVTRVKIGIIDTQRVMKEAKAAQKARAILLDDLKDKRETFTRKQEDVLILEQELKQEEKDLDPKVLKYKRDKLTQEVKNLRRLKVDLEEELNKKNAELTQQITREIWEIVNEYRKKGKYTLILEMKSVVTFDEAVDITDKILRLYDTKKKK
jgi:outer membrane protein